MPSTTLSLLKKIPLIKEIHEVPYDEAIKSRILAQPNSEFRLKMAQEHAKLVRVFRMKYLSNGHLVVGFVLEPRKAAKKLPCIIYNRGGSGDFGRIEPEGLFLRLALMASWGYLVIASQYSGNDGGEGKDEMGGEDLEDVLALHKILKSYSRADVTRIGMYGGSRGGMMTYQCLAKVRWLKAAVVVAGSADHFRSEKLRPEMIVHHKKMYGGSIKEKKKRSAVLWVNKFSKKAPVLLIHGTSDWRVSPLDSLDMSREMLREKVPHRLVMFEGADHNITEFSGIRFEMAHKWLDRYVRDGEKLPNLKLHGD